MKLRSLMISTGPARLPLSATGTLLSNLLSPYSVCPEFFLEGLSTRKLLGEAQFLDSLVRHILWIDPKDFGRHCKGSQDLLEQVFRVPPRIESLPLLRGSIL